MPDFSTRQKPDFSDLANDDVRSLKDGEIRDALYRVTQKMTACFDYQQLIIEELIAAVTKIEDSLP